MVNTVGSYKTNKFWNKKWTEIKNKLRLSNRQKSVIFGSLLGDGTMRIGKDAINANFKVEHGLKQKDFVFWKFKELKNFVFTEPKLSFRYDENGSKYQKSWWFRTIRHPEITTIYRMFYLGDGYKTGKKVVPNNIYLDKYLNPLALSIWIMDDGSNNNKSINISTYSFSHNDVKRLKSYLQKRYLLNSKIYKDRDIGYRIFFNKINTRALVQIISPYFINSMKYKLVL